MTAPPTTTARLVADLERTLRSTPADEALAPLRAEYLAFLAHEGVAAVERSRGRSHITASAFVLSADRTAVLLCFHRKGDFWVQLGGHVEPDDGSVEAAALREAQEEGGILELAVIDGGPLDLDRHDLGAGFTACDTHWDIGYGFVADGGAEPRVSAESAAVAWWPLAALPDRVPPGFATRVGRAAAAAEARLAQRP